RAANANRLALSRHDRSPLVSLTDPHPAGLLAFATHQALDHPAFLRAILKDSLTVTAGAAADQVARAGHLALAQPRGNVHLDLPADIAGQPSTQTGSRPTPGAPSPPSVAELDRAADMIRRARRRVVLAGLHCRG